MDFHLKTYYVQMKPGVNVNDHNSNNIYCLLCTESWAQDVSPIIFILTKTLESDGDGDSCL